MPETERSIKDHQYAPDIISANHLQKIADPQDKFSAYCEKILELQADFRQ